VLFAAAEAEFESKEKEMGTEILLRLFRHYYLEEIDRQWVDHLTNMEHLRDGIGLRGYGQRDPKQEYKKEGYDVFMTMMASTSSTVCSNLFKAQVRRENDLERMERDDAARHAAQQRAMQMRHGSEVAGADPDGTPPPPRAAAGASRVAQRAAVQPVRREGPKVGRNDPCPCGSGQKFKKCHGAALEDDAETAGDDAQI
jgi:preprotein translocase subunit SecA